MVIEEYNDDWKNQYEQIKYILENSLSKAIKFEHVGSTSITGMWAKPIIDIDVVIESINDFEKTKDELKIIGYLHEGDMGIIGREVFKKDNVIKNEILDKVNHHLYVCTKDNEELKRHILFRDYLNKHYEIKMEYNNIKKAIIEKYGNEDRKKFVDIKETEYKWFFEEVLKKAKMENILFETNRIIVRKLSLNDSELLFKYSQEEITKRELPDEVYENISDIKNAIKYFMINYDYEYNFVYPLVYGIVHKNKNIIIGHIGLTEIDKGIEIGYAIATEYQNNGYMSEIILPFINWIKNHLRLEKIYGIAKKENMASWKILEKNGFELEDECMNKNYFGGKCIVKIYSKIIC